MSFDPLECRAFSPRIDELREIVSHTGRDDRDGRRIVSLCQPFDDLAYRSIAPYDDNQFKAARTCAH